MDGCGVRPLRWLSELVLFVFANFSRAFHAFFFFFFFFYGNETNKKNWHFSLSVVVFTKVLGKIANAIHNGDWEMTISAMKPAKWFLFAQDFHLHQLHSRNVGDFRMNVSNIPKMEVVGKPSHTPVWPPPILGIHVVSVVVSYSNLTMFKKKSGHWPLFSTSQAWGLRPKICGFLQKIPHFLNAEKFTAVCCHVDCHNLVSSAYHAFLFSS